MAFIQHVNNVISECWKCTMHITIATYTVILDLGDAGGIRLIQLDMSINITVDYGSFPEIRHQGIQRLWVRV